MLSRPFTTRKSRVPRMKAKTVQDLVRLRHHPEFDRRDEDAGYLDGIIDVLTAERRQPDPDAQYAKHVAALEHRAATHRVQSAKM